MGEDFENNTISRWRSWFNNWINTFRHFKGPQFSGMEKKWWVIISFFCACLCAPQKRKSPTSHHHLPLTQLTNHVPLINEYHLRTGSMLACLNKCTKKKKKKKVRWDNTTWMAGCDFLSHFHQNFAWKSYMFVWVSVLFWQWWMFGLSPWLDSLCFFPTRY